MKKLLLDGLLVTAGEGRGRERGREGGRCGVGMGEGKIVGEGEGGREGTKERGRERRRGKEREGGQLFFFFLTWNVSRSLQGNLPSWYVSRQGGRSKLHFVSSSFQGCLLSDMLD